MSEPEDWQVARDELDAAVRKYTAVNLAREGIVTGWVLTVASTRFDDEGDAVYAYDYSVAPDTDLIRAVGLVELGRRRIYDDIRPGGPLAYDEDESP